MFLNHIHLAMSLNNNYIYPIMVSITSILLNSKKNTFIHIHILFGNDVKKEDLKKILSLQRIKIFCGITFHNIGNNFKGWKHQKKKLTVASFYRSIVGEIIKNISKIIYLDGDTLTYRDLSEMYKLNMRNLYFRGVHEIISHKYDKYFKRNKFICAGVMLMNLELIRKDNFFNTFKKYYKKFYKKGILLGDQYIINTFFYKKIGFLPPKFGMWFINEKDIEKYKNLNPLIYTEKELRESINKPVIKHLWGITKEGFLSEKPWLLKKYYKIKVEWNYYAKKTGYYSSICNFFKYACKNLK